MKKMSPYLIVLVAALVLAGAAFADSLAVNGSAAMGGSTYGLDLTHDNSSIAYVQDDTPNDESVYRAEFLFAAPSVVTSINYRQAIFVALGQNPRPGVGLCHPTQPVVESIRCFHYQIWGGTTVSFQCFSRGDWCGESFTAPLLFLNDADVDTDGEIRVCIEWESNAGTNAGKIRLALVDDADSCSSASWTTGNVTNNDCNVEFVRLGTPQVNYFSAGEAATYYFDDFQSFRTLASSP
ncbi:MAG: hypothetical protein GY856_08720 [bacterium]|nr:hypothetical protein [bacterium]